MPLHEISVVLRCASLEISEFRSESHSHLQESKRTQDRIGELKSRIEALQKRIGPVDISSPPSPTEEKPIQIPKRREIDWAQLKARSEDRLLKRGIDPSLVSVNELLDPSEVARIEARFTGGFQISSNLDSYDILVSISAGLVAALVDFLVVRIPKEMTYARNFQQAGSPLTKWIKSFNVPSNNWLANYFKTSFDPVNLENPIDGFSPGTHRLQSFGHDPLIGLVVGTIDVIMGGLTGVSRSGDLSILSGLGEPHDPLVALIFEIGHLLSDAPTKMGLPPPGFSLFQFLNVGAFGEKERTIGELARFMYLKGYDSRHFLTMSTSVVAAEVVLRAYFALRQKLDQDYASHIEGQKRQSGATSVSGHPKFQAMALIAHLIASASNAGKVAVYQGNPLAINYAQWLRFVQAAIMFTSTRFASPSSVLIRHAKANLAEIEDSWPKIETEAADFPTMVV